MYPIVKAFDFRDVIRSDAENQGDDGLRSVRLGAGGAAVGGSAEAVKVPATDAGAAQFNFSLHTLINFSAVRAHVNSAWIRSLALRPRSSASG